MSEVFTDREVLDTFKMNDLLIATLQSEVMELKESRDYWMKSAEEWREVADWEAQGDAGEAD